MKKILTGFLILTIFFLNQVDLKPQSNHFLSEMRPGDLLQEDIELDFFSMTRFMQNILSNSLESWTSPSTKISIDGIPFNVLPFNLNSPDFLPLDHLMLDKISAGVYPQTENRHVYSFGGINFITKEIEDSMTLKFRGYTGSETGDPLIHSFTRVNTPSVNINKIPLSGSASFSDAFSNLKYRFSFGYFAHFSSSSVNDPVMAFRNPRFYSKLDKQVLASAELVWSIGSGKNLFFNPSFMSYYGWDIPPFQGSIIHFESYIFSVRSGLTNLFNGFNLTLRTDASLTEINGMTGIPPAKFLIMENSLIGEWDILKSDKMTISLTPEAGLYTINNRQITSVPVHQNFFETEFEKINLRLSGSADYKFDESLNGDLNVKFERHFSGKSAVSFESAVSKEFGDAEIKVSAVSAARFPSASDLYGRFQIFEGEKPLQNTYSINGSSDLKEERINNLGIDAAFRFPESFFSAAVFLREILNPVMQKTLNIKRTGNPGDILRDAVYTNGEKKSCTGLLISCSNTFFRHLSLTFSYRFIKNTGTEFFPRNKVSVSAAYGFAAASSSGFTWFYREESKAGEYVLSSENDELLHAGFNGKTPAVSNLNFYFNQNLSAFYIFNSLSFKISIENILGRKIKFFPSGNEMRRGFVLFLSGSI